MRRGDDMDRNFNIDLSVIDFGSVVNRSVVGMGVRGSHRLHQERIYARHALAAGLPAKNAMKTSPRLTLASTAGTGTARRQAAQRPVVQVAAPAISEPMSSRIRSARPGCWCPTRPTGLQAMARLG